MIEPLVAQTSNSRYGNTALTSARDENDEHESTFKGWLPRGVLVLFLLFCAYLFLRLLISGPLPPTELLALRILKVQPDEPSHSRGSIHNLFL